MITVGRIATRGRGRAPDCRVAFLTAMRLGLVLGEA